MAVLNLILSITFVQEMGALGVYLASVISRLCTLVWFDAFLIYKYVFGKKPWNYYLDYCMKMLTVAASCASAHLICLRIVFGNVFVSFICKGLICTVVSASYVLILCRKNESFVAAKRMALKLVKKHM